MSSSSNPKSAAKELKREEAFLTATSVEGGRGGGMRETEEDSDSGVLGEAALLSTVGSRRVRTTRERGGQSQMEQREKAEESQTASGCWCVSLRRSWLGTGGDSFGLGGGCSSSGG